MMMTMAWIGIAFDAHRDLHNRTSDLLGVWLDNIERSKLVYERVESLPVQDCSEQHLNLLNSLVYKNRQITNIWFFPDGDTKSACASSFGRFEPALDFGPPDSINLFSDGRSLWYRVPFDRVEGVGSVTLFKQNRYAVSFFRTGKLQGSSEDLMFVSDIEDPHVGLYYAEGNPDLLTRAHNSLGPVIGHVYAKACGEGFVRLCYLTMIRFDQVVEENSTLIAIFAGFSLFTGLLVSQPGVPPRARVQQSVRPDPSRHREGGRRLRAALPALRDTGHHEMRRLRGCRPFRGCARQAVSR
ncbi:CSS-motif domain-containing protein [Labrenzia sp. OB1]|uniref:CSS-motif domain-containing protein n=1 Tax=Labrenzia sp. OB1 TaxID=1561204 RepID=UPI0018FEA0FA|nr:CSS-motif domain-containing protein [Labrenzia sp. OB1]